MDVLVDEPGYDRLMRTVREAELGGHDPAAVLAEAVGARQAERHGHRLDRQQGVDLDRGPELSRGIGF
jgi:hypothetical protein